jgi:hypothetical protein
VLVDTTFAVTLFCAGCGKLHLEKLSLFELSGTARRNIVCACGKVIGSLRTVSMGHYELSASCAVCGERHSARFSREISSGAETVALGGSCRLANLGFVGSLRTARDEFARRQERLRDYLAAPLTAETTAGDPSVRLFELINRLDDLAAQDNIYCGNCGGSVIGIEVFDNFVVLFCSDCGNMFEFSALTREDVERVRTLKFIELAPGR